VAAASASLGQRVAVRVAVQRVSQVSHPSVRAWRRSGGMGCLRSKVEEGGSRDARLATGELGLRINGREYVFMVAPPLAHGQTGGRAAAAEREREREREP
jgi:hypothetical protein